MVSNSEEIIIKNLDHLGIVAGLIDEIGIVEIINKKLGIDCREKVTSGQVIKALLLNSMGMVSRPLYLFSQFFEDKAVDKLLGEGVKCEYLNDDKIGRVMDEIYRLGLTSLFIEIGLSVIKKFKIETKFSHLDSTSFHLHGKYLSKYFSEEDAKNQKERPILITRGYSRDHRPDLKQCVLDLIIVSDGAIPFLMRAADGNESDKAVFGQILVEVKKQIEFESIMVCDSALYSQNNLQLIREIQWITRVPTTIKQARNLLEEGEIEEIEISSDLEEEEKQRIIKHKEKGYKWREEKVTYGEIQQRWLIVESEKRKKSDYEKLELKLKQEEKQIEKRIQKLGKEKFADLKTAQEHLKTIESPLKFLTFKKVEFLLFVNKAGENLYKIKVEEVGRKTDEIEKRRRAAGRFILATNILDEREVTSSEILEIYKNQQDCERGFGFLKDPLFFTDSFFVEKPERVETILFLMSLSLMVYNLGQRELRNALKKAQAGVENQVGKITDSPTLRWIFQCFQGIHLLKLNETQKIVNLTEKRSFILEYLPTACQKYYL